MDDPADAETENFWRMMLQLRLATIDSATARSTKDVADAARHKIDTELRAMRRIMSLARTRRNDMASTARFPAEVLAHIFTVLSQCDPPSTTRLLTPNDVLYRPHILGWITVTHVCSLWRQLALSMPALWSNIGAPHTAFWINEMLERSKEVPFRLAIEIGLQNSGDINDAILKAVGPDHVSRLKSLYIAAEKGELDNEDAGEEDSEDGSEADEDGSEEDSEDGSVGTSDPTLQMLQEFKLPAPLLESIRFNATDFAQPIPSDIFASTLPRLREVMYGRCKDVPWTAGFFCNITYLDLQLPARKSSSTLLGLLSLLEQSPGLEKLLLVDSEPNHSIGALRPPAGRRISLPCLEYLYLFSTHGFIFTGLLAALDIGLSADVAIVGDCPGDPGGIQDFMVLAAKLFSRGDINVHQASSNSLWLACNKLKTDKVYINIQISDLSRDNRLFVMRPSVQQAAWSLWLPALFRYLDLQFITTLELSGDCIPPSGILIQVLALMDGLSKLVLHNLAAHKVIPLLCPGKPKPWVGGKKEVYSAAVPMRDRAARIDINSGSSSPQDQLSRLPLLPNLSHLTVKHVDLSTMVAGDMQNDPEVFAEVLGNAMFQRSLLGRRLVLLTLSNCTHSFAYPHFVFEKYEKHVDAFSRTTDDAFP